MKKFCNASISDAGQQQRRGSRYSHPFNLFAARNAINERVILFGVPEQNTVNTFLV